MADDYGTVRVAENNLRSHINQLVYEEQAAFKHFLMNQHAAFGLCRHNEHDTQQVRSEPRPGGVGYRHDGAVDKRFYLVCFLCGNVNIIASLFELDAQTAEALGDDSQILVRNILNGDFTFRHGCHTDKAANLNHIGQYGVLCAMQSVHPFDGKQVGRDTANLRSHPVEQAAKLLNVRLAGCIINSGSAFGKHGSHHDIGCSGDGSLVQQHIIALKLFGGNLVDSTLLIVAEVCP